MLMPIVQIQTSLPKSALSFL